MLHWPDSYTFRIQDSYKINSNEGPMIIRKGNEGLWYKLPLVPESPAHSDHNSNSCWNVCVIIQPSQSAHAAYLWIELSSRKRATRTRSIIWTDQSKLRLLSFSSQSPKLLWKLTLHTVSPEHWQLDARTWNLYWFHKFSTQRQFFDTL